MAVNEINIRKQNLDYLNIINQKLTLHNIMI